MDDILTPAAAIRAAFVAARTPRDLAKACDALMDADVEPDELEALRQKREAAILSEHRSPARSCACGFGQILAEADSRIAARAANLKRGGDRKSDAFKGSPEPLNSRGLSKTAAAASEEAAA